MPSSDAKSGRKWERSLPRRVGEIYTQIFRVYRAWWMYILPFAALILIPIDLLDALTDFEVRHLVPDNVLELFLVAALTAILASTSLFGQVFMAGAIGLSLAHTRGGKPPRLGWLAREISYGRLIAVDVIYLVLVLAGTIALIVPGLIFLILFSLAGPAVEVEDRSIRGAFARSYRLVRTDFWLVLAVLLSIQIAGYTVGEATQALVGSLLGDATWLEAISKGISSMLLEPLFAIAAVLLMIRLSGSTPPPVASPGHRPVPVASD